MSHTVRAQQGGPRTLTDPKNLRVLVIDGKGSSRQNACTLLRECQYQVTAARTCKEAMQLLATHSLNGSEAPFDLILKDHEPPASNACRLLRKIAKTEHVRRIPVIVISGVDDRDVVAKCLNLGATDYLVKPLRHNELRNIWTRIWWWRRPAAQLIPLSPVELDFTYPCVSQASSSASEETKCSDDEEEPTSKEGSAPDGIGNGSNGNGSNGSKEGNGTSRVEAKPHGPGNGSNGNGNGSSDNKNGNGNSATKNGHNGSNGNGASTTLIPERPGSCALAGTAEGKAKPLEQNGDHDDHPPINTAGVSAFARYTGPSSSRKRNAADMATAQGARDEPCAEQQQRSKAVVHRERQQLRSAAVSTPSTHTASEDTLQAQQGSGAGAGVPHPHVRGHDMRSTQGSMSPAAAFAALHHNLTRSVPHLQGHPHTHVPHWNSAHPSGLPTAQAAQNLHSAQTQMSLAGLFQHSHYGLPPQMLQQLQQMQHPLAQLYSASSGGYGGSSNSNSAAVPPSAATVEGMGTAASHFYSPHNFMGEGMHADAAGAARMRGHEGLAGNVQQQYLLSLLYQQLNQQQMQSTQHQLQSQQMQQQAAALNAAAAGQAAWRPSGHHTNFPGYQPFVGPPASAPDTSLASGGNGATQHTNGTSALRTRSAQVAPPEHHRHRAAALDKYRKKRKNLKYSKTIRYESRKQLAQQRPRIKGQFVKHAKPAGGEADTQTNGQSKADDGSWQDEDYDQDEELDEMDEEDECEENDAEEKMMEAEEEADVVNSLRELRNPERLSGPPGKLDSALGSVPLGLRTPAGSRGSHGHGSHGHTNTRALSMRQLSGDGRGHTGDNHHQSGEASNHGHGKNGSDSGSNSPDENGRRDKHSC